MPSPLICSSCTQPILFPYHRRGRRGSARVREITQLVKGRAEPHTWVAGHLSAVSKKTRPEGLGYLLQVSEQVWDFKRAALSIAEAFWMTSACLLFSEIVPGTCHSPLVEGTQSLTSDSSLWLAWQGSGHGIAPWLQMMHVRAPLRTRRPEACLGVMELCFSLQDLPSRSGLAIEL